jgi:hypothetical protein
MLIYKCRVTGDEMISDAYNLRDVVDDEGNVVPELMECDSLSVNKDSGANVDVGGGNAFGGGGEDEAPEDTSENVNNVIDEGLGFGYNECPMGKKDFKDFLKSYCGAVRTMLKEDPKIEGPEVKAFTQAAPEFCKFLLKKADDLQFYMSSSFNPDGCMALAYYKEGALQPTFIYIKKGLIEEKC